MQSLALPTDVTQSINARIERTGGAFPSFVVEGDRERAQHFCFGLKHLAQRREQAVWKQRTVSDTTRKPVQRGHRFHLSATRRKGCVATEHARFAHPVGKHAASDSKTRTDVK